MPTTRKSTLKTSAKKKARKSSYEWDEENEPEPVDRVTQLLQTGDLPTEDERVHFAELLEQRSVDLQVKRSEIRRLEAEVAAMESERADYARILSTMRVIPAEILSQIFLMSIPSDCAYHHACHPNDIYDSLHPVRAPQWVLSRVSKYWRNVALSCPALWAQVSLVFGSDMKTAGQVKRLPPILNLQLSRSGNVPLFVSIHATAYSLYSNITQKHRSLIDSLCDTVGRWESFFYAISRRHSYLILPSQVPINLKSLFVQSYSGYASPWQSLANRTAFNEATSLSQFGGPVIALRDLSIDYSELIEFTGTSPRWAASASDVELLFGIRKFTVEMTLSALYRPAFSPKIGIFQNLTHLIIVSVDGVGNAATFLAGLRFPELKHLSFPHCCSSSSLFNTDFPAMTTLLSDSNADLLELRLKFDESLIHIEGPGDLTRCGPEAFIDFLASQPMAKLEVLSLSNSSIDFSSALNTALKRKATGESTFPFLPDLRRLEMCQDSRYSIRLMKEMQAQRPRLSVLQSLEPEKKEMKAVQTRKKPVKTKKRKRKVQSSDEEDSNEYDSEYDD